MDLTYDFAKCVGELNYVTVAGHKGLFKGTHTAAIEIQQAGVKAITSEQIF